MGIFDIFSRKKTPPVRRMDGWESEMLGIGTSRDKLADVLLSAGGVIAGETLRALYKSNSIAAKIVDTLPAAMMREGHEVQGVDVSGCEIDIDLVVARALIWSRLFGGAGIWIGANDGQEPWIPMRDQDVASVDFLTPFDLRYLTPVTYQSDPTRPYFGLPDVYQVSNPYGGASGIYVHASRIIRFSGEPTDYTTEREQRSWGLSVLQRPYEALRDLGMSYQIAMQLLSDASQGVFKLTDVYGMIAGGDKENMQTRMGLVDQMRSVSRSIILDKDGEDFTRIATPMGGIPEVIQLMMSRVASAASIPQTLLFGASPGGLNSTGDSDSRGWYDTVRAEQRRVLFPVYMRIYKLLAHAKNTPIDGIRVTFRPLWTASAVEQATLDKSNADRDAQYIHLGVWTPEEVAIQRAEGNTTTSGTAIDVGARQATISAMVEAVGTAGEARQVELASTDIATITTVDEARASLGLAPWGNAAEGALTMAEFKIRSETVGEIDAKQQVTIPGATPAAGAQGDDPSTPA